MFVGELYPSYLFQGALLTSWLGEGRLFLGILCGHLIVFGALLAPAVDVGAAVHLDVRGQLLAGQVVKLPFVRH